MAGDWIKMRTDLYRDPKVCVMADHLMNEDGELGNYVNQNKQRNMTVTRNVMRNVTVGALVSVWGVFRHRGRRNGDDLILSRVTLAVIDDVADLPGFGAAMEAVGWAVESKSGVVFPRFFEDYNVEPTSESKSKNALRQQRFREKSNGVSNVTSNVTGALQSNDREEKSREEKSREENKDTPKAPNRKTKTPRDGESCPLFSQFWSAYPRRVGKPKAALAFAALRPTEELLASMLAALKWQKATDQWSKDNGEFIPYPTSWLNARRWEDEPLSKPIAANSRQFPGVADNDVSVVVTIRARYKSKDYDRERAELELKKINPNYTGAILDAA